MISLNPDDRMTIAEIFKYFSEKVVDKKLYLYLYYLDSILIN